MNKFGIKNPVGGSGKGYALMAVSGVSIVCSAGGFEA